MRCAQAVVGLEGRFIRAGGIRLWVESGGDGPPILFLPGLGYASWCWKEAAADLMSRGRAVLLDNRGSGRSRAVPDEIGIGELADDAAAVLEALGSGSAHVVGHSMGGYIAMEMALGHPDRVRSLVLVSTSMGGAEAVMVPPDTLLAWVEAAELGPDEFARRTMPLSFSASWARENGERYARLLSARLEHPTPVQNWRSQFMACARHLAVGVPIDRLAVPTTVIHGTADRVVPFENGVRLHERLSLAKLRLLEDSGHLCFLEQPGRFAEIMNEHLDWVEQER